MSIEGAILNANYDWNEAYYGKKVSPLGIVEKKLVSNPGSAELRKTIQNSLN
jgi:lipid-binding SYLF domain-containing protein